MSLIESLIEMKKESNQKDIISMLDEFTLYDKLSEIKALGDIESSKALQSRLPHLAKLINGEFYQLSLAFIARDILTHLEYEIPEAIHNHIANIPKRTQDQLRLAGDSTVQAEYRELAEYDPVNNLDEIIGVYINELEEDDMVRIIIIVSNSRNKYIVYQGEYQEINGEVVDKNISSPHDMGKHKEKTENGTIIIDNYSIQGNNTHPFAVYINTEGKYYISIPDTEHLAISKDTPPQWSPKENRIINEAAIIDLTPDEANRLNIGRSNVNKFASSIGKIIDRWEDMR